MAEGEYEDQDESVIEWSGCVSEGCYEFIMTDEYGDGVNGSQWGSCDVDGDMTLTTPEGAVILALGDPDFGGIIELPFCLPSVQGCTDAGACNYEEEANADDGSCFFIGDSCEDGDPETILDTIQEDCSCSGVPQVEGCTDETACNYIMEANVNDGSCVFVGLGDIEGNTMPQNGLVETYTYNDATAGNSYTWTVNGGDIQTASTGVDVTSVDVLWTEDGFGSIAVTESHGSFTCEAMVSETVNVLINTIGEWQKRGISVYPNPVRDVLYIEWPEASGRLELTLVDGRGRQIWAQPWIPGRQELSMSDLDAGVYTLILSSDEALNLSLPVVRQ